MGAPVTPCSAALSRIEFFHLKFVRGLVLAMARKRKPKPFRAVTAVKELARERVGAPPPEKIVVEKKKKPEKHKPTMSKLLNESE